MTPALIIAVSLVAFLVVLFVVIILVLKLVTGRLRKSGQAEIDKRFAPADVLMSETLAQSFGVQSKGAGQMRGSGALALTKGELFFAMYVPSSELRIPLTSIMEVTMPRSHLGKSQGAALLHVRYTIEGTEDAIAWRVPSPEGWKSKIESLRG